MVKTTANRFKQPGLSIANWTTHSYCLKEEKIVYYMREKNFICPGLFTMSAEVEFRVYFFM